MVGMEVGEEVGNGETRVGVFEAVNNEPGFGDEFGVGEGSGWRIEEVSGWRLRWPGKG